MQGLTENTLQLFNQIADKSFLKEYSFIGGSALAVQIGHRLSEDLDLSKSKQIMVKDEIVDI